MSRGRLALSLSKEASDSIQVLILEVETEESPSCVGEGALLKDLPTGTVSFPPLCSRRKKLSSLKWKRRSLSPWGQREVGAEPHQSGSHLIFPHPSGWWPSTGGLRVMRAPEQFSHSTSAPHSGSTAEATLQIPLCHLHPKIGTTLSNRGQSHRGQSQEPGKLRNTL